MSESNRQRPSLSPVASYKRVLQRVLENRPSGTRQRLALALGTNRSFVSQMSNPAYAMPIPSPHLDVIFELCHFSHPDRAEFLEAYVLAHPDRAEASGSAARTRVLSVAVADLGDPLKNRTLDEMVKRFAEQIGRFADDIKS
jgi:hypothetical protein